MGTLLYQLLRFGVSATTALWIVPYVLLGLCVGAVSARHGYACTPRQLALLAVLGELGITVLNTGSLYVDSLIYGYYSPVFVFGTLPLRLAICAGKGIVLALLLPTLLRVARRARCSRGPTENRMKNRRSDRSGGFFARRRWISLSGKACGFRRRTPVPYGYFAAG